MPQVKQEQGQELLTITGHMIPPFFLSGVRVAQFLLSM
jgi:hypothetical protein